MTATFYKKDDSGEYVDARDDVENYFRERSGEIVRKKLNELKERELEKVREEAEGDIRKNLTEKLESEIKAKFESDYKAKSDEYESKIHQLDTALRRKTIAAEYGFKPETEQFLGDGDEDDMRAKADVLKNSFGNNGSAPLEKSVQVPKVSELQEKTGIKVEI